MGSDWVFSVCHEEEVRMCSFFACHTDLYRNKRLIITIIDAMICIVSPISAASSSKSHLVNSQLKSCIPPINGIDMVLASPT